MKETKLSVNGNVEEKIFCWSLVRTVFLERSGQENVRKDVAKRVSMKYDVAPFSIL